MRPSYLLMEALSKAQKVADITGYAAIRDVPGEPELYYVDGPSADDFDADFDDGPDPVDRSMGLGLPSLDDIFDDNFEGMFQNSQDAAAPQSLDPRTQGLVDVVLMELLNKIIALLSEMVAEVGKSDAEVKALLK